MGRLWWIEFLEMKDDFETLLHRAVMEVDDCEMDNYGYIGEQLWAEQKGWA